MFTVYKHRLVIIIVQRIFLYDEFIAVDNKGINHEFLTAINIITNSDQSFTHFTHNFQLLKTLLPTKKSFVNKEMFIS